uniref:Transcription factor n=1 Tax=Rhizophora mucronata TaxID=61149 RepID=A0A2P2M025_RHIMU
MVCTANDLLAWKDFPKGLRVLLLDEDTSSAAEMKSKLEAMDYFVSTFCNESEALSAISHKPEGFHVAIVEVTTSNSNGSFKFLEAAKDLPTISEFKKRTPNCSIWHFRLFPLPCKCFLAQFEFPTLSIVTIFCMLAPLHRALIESFYQQH